ncbi:MAG TPA: circadian clock KaiB family protein [Syntrophorhabdaceae bacterium]|nr:circadian clock KaiB family protein [Syntrophorhabdaceae bacterium]
MSRKGRHDADAPESNLREFGSAQYVLRLYVAGATNRASHAILDIKEMCEKYLKGRCELEVIDIYQQPVLARGEQIIPTPTLIKKLPLPLRRFIGNMEDKEKLLIGLDLVEKQPRKRKKTS